MRFAEKLATGKTGKGTTSVVPLEMPNEVALAAEDLRASISSFAISRFVI